MDRETGEQIERLTKEATGILVKIDGRDYSPVPLHDPRKKEAEPAALVVATLESLIEYVKSDHDGDYFERRGGFVHVESPTSVRHVTELFGEFHQRVTMCHAKALVPSLAFGTWMDPETFQILLGTHFEPSGDRDKVRALCGNLVTEEVQTIADDGIKQEAVARRGFALARTEVPNPVTLRPFRTFLEIAQPDSPFLLRLRGGSAERSQLPACALFEADGGAWQNEAIARIKAHLRKELGDDFTVIG